MPQQAIQSSSIPPLPPGYALDSAGTPPLPPGYALDSAPTATPTPAAPPPPSGIAGAWGKFKSAVQGPINISGFPNISRQANEVKDMATGAVKGMSEMTAPSMAGELYNRLTGQPNNLKQLPGKIVTQGVPMMLGDPEADAGETAAQPARPAAQAPAAAPAPAPPGPPGPTLPGILARHIPVVGKVLRGMDTINDLKTLFSKSAEPAPAPPAPKPSAQPIPETNGIPWGSGGKGTLDMRGKMIPKAQEPLPDQPSAAPQWPANYQAGAQTPDATGGGGANYSSADLAAFKAKHGITAPAPNQLDTLLQNAVGNKPIKPGVTMKNQGSAPAPAPSDIPAGHTPVTSEALKSYKYDPDAREFHAQYNSNPGKIHVFGDVSSEDAQAFEQAKSKGGAMQMIRKNPEVARIIGGKRVALTPSGRGSTNDLGPTLQKMLDQAKAGNAATE
jgi:hypothetical protein